jgi:hypothetical protein
MQHYYKPQHAGPLLRQHCYNVGTIPECQAQHRTAQWTPPGWCGSLRIPALCLWMPYLACSSHLCTACAWIQGRRAGRQCAGPSPNCITTTGLSLASWFCDFTRANAFGGCIHTAHSACTVPGFGLKTKPNGLLSDALNMVSPGDLLEQGIIGTCGVCYGTSEGCWCQGLLLFQPQD